MSLRPQQRTMIISSSSRVSRATLAKFKGKIVLRFSRLREKVGRWEGERMIIIYSYFKYGREVTKDLAASRSCVWLLWNCWRAAKRAKKEEPFNIS